MHFEFSRPGYMQKNICIGMIWQEEQLTLKFVMFGYVFRPGKDILWPDTIHWCCSPWEQPKAGFHILMDYNINMNYIGNDVDAFLKKN